MLKLIQTDWCEFDLAFDVPGADPADDETDAAVATLIFGVLFTDQQAPLRRISDPYDRRGWYKDPQAGSGLWHVRRQSLTKEARLEAISRVERALKQKAPALKNILVREITTPDASGNVSSVFLEIAGTHNGRKFLVRSPLTDS